MKEYKEFITETSRGNYDDDLVSPEELEKKFVLSGANKELVRSAKAAGKKLYVLYALSPAGRYIERLRLAEV